MASSNPRFILTGFGPFQNVPRNPTTEIMENFSSIYQNDADMAHVEIDSCHVLETSAQGSLESLRSIFKSASESSVPTIFIHCGVASRYTNFAIERFGYNLANFSIPDERGYQPQEEPILGPDDSTESLIQTKLPIDELIQDLKSKGWNRLVPSIDPGRFVCNWVYFHSLYLTTPIPNAYSLFVHVPPFSQICFEDQCGFLKDLILTIVKFLPSQDSPSRNFETNDRLNLLESLLKVGFESEICELAVLQPSVIDISSGVNWILARKEGDQSNSITTAIDEVNQSNISEFQKNIKLVILVRQDLEMGKGKIAAQCTHAALGAYHDTESEPDTLIWEESGEPIICLKVSNFQEMNNLCEQARKKNIPISLVHDAGRTQVAPGSVTVAGIGPAEATLIDSVTGHLKLL